MRAGVEVLKIFPPTAGRSTLVFGFERFVTLNALKYSARNSRKIRSVKWKSLWSERSWLEIPGPRKMFLPALPIVNGAGIGKSAILNHWLRLWFATDPVPATFGRVPYCRPEFVGSAEPRVGVN